MKKLIIKLLLLLGVLTFISAFPMLKAQNTSIGTSQGEQAFIGSDSKLENIVLKTDSIFVGEISQIGFVSLTARGEESYYGTKIKILQVLQGTIDNQITATFKRRSILNEQAPKVGVSYIFFVKKTPGQPNSYTVLKLLPATGDNITKVKALIAAAPAPK